MKLFINIDLIAENKCSTTHKFTKVDQNSVIWTIIVSMLYMSKAHPAQLDVSILRGEGVRTVWLPSADTNLLLIGSTA